jgi:hypothetical protein
VQERGEQRPVSWREPHPRATELPLQHSDLVAQCKDLEVFVPGAHREQAKHGEGVPQAEVGQSQQHGRSSCRGDRCHESGRSRCHRKQDLTSGDEVSGKRNVDAFSAVFVTDKLDGDDLDCGGGSSVHRRGDEPA